MIAAARFIIALWFAAVCANGANGSSALLDLLELVEQRAVASLNFGERHPQVRALDRQISERLAAGERYDLRKARLRLDELRQERQELGKKLGRGHRNMIINARRIRAISSILENAENASNSAPSAGSGESVDTRGDSRPDGQLEWHELRSQLLQQMRGDWELDAELSNDAGHSIPRRVTIENIFLRRDISDEEISRVPDEHRQAFQAPWTCFTYHRNLQAIEFRKMMVNAVNDWEPHLDRRYATIKDGKLVIVFRDDVKLLPRSLEANEENHVYEYRLLPPPDQPRRKRKGKRN